VAKLSDYVVRFIADQGVEHVFLVTGGGAMHLDESLARETSIAPSDSSRCIAQPPVTRKTCSTRWSAMKRTT